MLKIRQIITMLLMLLCLIGAVINTVIIAVEIQLGVIPFAALTTLMFCLICFVVIDRQQKDYL